MNMGGYSHATLSLLEKIDDVHYRFFRDLDVTSSDACLEHAFAPPSLRRNLGILGLIHKKNHRQTPPQLRSLIAIVGIEIL